MAGAGAAGRRLPMAGGRRRQPLGAPCRARRHPGPGHDRQPHRHPARGRLARWRLRRDGRAGSAARPGRRRPEHPPPHRGDGLDERRRLALRPRCHGLQRLCRSVAAGPLPGGPEPAGPALCHRARQGHRRHARCRASAPGPPGARLRRGPHRTRPGARGRRPAPGRGHLHPGRALVRDHGARQQRPRRHHAHGRAARRPAQRRQSGAPPARRRHGPPRPRSALDRGPLRGEPGFGQHGGRPSALHR